MHEVHVSKVGRVKVHHVRADRWYEARSTEVTRQPAASKTLPNDLVPAKSSSRWSIYIAREKYFTSTPPLVMAATESETTTTWTEVIALPIP